MPNLNSTDLTPHEMKLMIAGLTTQIKLLTEDLRVAREVSAEHQKETDIEHQRYLEVQEKNKQLEEELFTTHHGVQLETGKTIKELIPLVKENKILEEKLDGVKEILQTETLATGIENRFYEILNDEEEVADDY